MLSKSGENINQHIICPKSLNHKDLLGYIDNDTRQWYDGVISTVSLQVASEKPGNVLLFDSKIIIKKAEA